MWKEKKNYVFCNPVYGKVNACSNFFCVSILECRNHTTQNTSQSVILVVGSIFVGRLVAGTTTAKKHFLEEARAWVLDLGMIFPPKPTIAIDFVDIRLFVCFFFNSRTLPLRCQMVGTLVDCVVCVII